MTKLGRNEPCHCGSGKKYKKCCIQKDKEKSLEQQTIAENIKLERTSYENREEEDDFFDDTFFDNDDDDIEYEDECNEDAEYSDGIPSHMKEELEKYSEKGVC